MSDRRQRLLGSVFGGLEPLSERVTTSNAAAGDEQFMKTRDDQAAEISKFFGVPQWMLTPFKCGLDFADLLFLYGDGSGRPMGILPQHLPLKVL